MQQAPTGARCMAWPFKTGRRGHTFTFGLQPQAQEWLAPKDVSLRRQKLPVIYIAPYTWQAAHILRGENVRTCHAYEPKEHRCSVR